jgi:D-alanine-D-alanine ligase
MPLRIAIVFDTPYPVNWGHDEHVKQMDDEFAGRIDVPEPEMEYQVAHALRENGHEIHLIGMRGDLGELIRRITEWRPELVFNCCEGFGGDDNLEYVVPSMLEALGVCYVGSPPMGLMVSRNKGLSKKVLAHHGIKVPGFITCYPGEAPPHTGDLSFPMIVKPMETDASQGIAQASVVHDADALAERITFVHEQFHQPAIAEEFVEGREVYVSVIGNRDKLEILPLTELVFDKEKNLPEERIATKAAKWHEGYRERRGIRNQFARPIAAQTRETIEHVCRTAFRLLWLRDYARCDVRLAADGQVWLLEANANPYIADGHDFAESAGKSGLAYPALIQRLVETALQRHGHAHA